MTIVHDITFIGIYLVLDAFDAFDCSAWRPSNEFGDGDEQGNMLQPKMSMINSSELNIRGECELRSYFCKCAWAGEMSAHALTYSKIDYSPLMGLLVKECGPVPSVCIPIGQAANNSTLVDITRPSLVLQLVRCSSSSGQEVHCHGHCPALIGSRTT